mmetsp:Transcript_1141/g.1031  ORF Transcript_1141/g.1031 Transcript_1141/m.1031 type:complete len:99 (+) Transcript_1141:108-404(+)
MRKGKKISRHNLYMKRLKCRYKNIYSKLCMDSAIRVRSAHNSVKRFRPAKESIREISINEDKFNDETPDFKSPMNLRISSESVQKNSSDDKLLNNQIL